ncbi:MAG TPA: pyridoxamine 5'-phosphate oxidase family protein [Kineosporiaceae bacterium]|nr:pyridoxamine 5'-phosphate oxidase family protein [Kineosporiaceae bacterium]
MTSSQPAAHRAPTDHRGITVLTLDECLDRLRSTPVGRIAFTEQGGPVILPVNHGVDGTDIVFRTTYGSKLQIAEDSGHVAFEADGIDVPTHRGWSVLVKGIASPVYEREAVERYEALGISAWAGLDPTSAVWIRLRAEEITGRELGGYPTVQG